MADEISISKTLSIRECGHDENWLQEKIAANPTILGLGDLKAIYREKQQSSGGKIDFLLEDSADDSMYEVEVMLGATDESHIIRTIEYWELERHRWPKRSHTAVLVAEKINRRFFNVIQLLSRAIPVIAVQANLIEADGKRMLHFTTILDAYQEPERTSSEPADENYWRGKASWTLDHAKALQEIFSRVLGEMKLRFTKNDIRLLHHGEIYFWLDWRSNRKSTFRTWLKSAEIPAATALLKSGDILYNVKPWPGDPEWQTIRWTVDQNSIKEKSKLFQAIAKLVERSWQSKKTS
jgi:hypothetical protein